MSGQSYYFSVYLVQLIVTLALVVTSYFERPILRTELTMLSGESSNVELVTKSASGREDDGTQTGNKSNMEGRLPWTKHLDPEGAANFLQRLFFTWLSPLLAYGYKHDIDEHDLPKIRQQFEANLIDKSFERVWEAEKIKAKAEGRAASLVNALFGCFGWYFAVAAPMLLIQNVAQLSLPFLLGYLIRFMDDNEPVLNGYLYSLGFFIGLMVTVGVSCIAASKVYRCPHQHPPALQTIAENMYFDRVVKVNDHSTNIWFFSSHNASALMNLRPV